VSLIGRYHGVAIIEGDRQLTFDEADDVVSRVANAVLAADLGAERRLAVFADNCAETVLAHLGGLFGSASTVPINHHLKAAEAAYVLADSGAQLLFTGATNLDIARDSARQAGVPQVVVWGLDREAQHPGVVSWDDWLATASPAEPRTDVVPRPHLIYTSGTTGRPRGVEQPPAMFPGGADMVEHVARLRSNRFAPFGTHLVAGPLHHTGPIQAVRLLAVGVPLTIPGRFDAERTLATIERDRAETSVMVPTHFSRLLALPPEVRNRYDVSSLRLVSHTGAPCPPAVKRAMIEWWGPILIDAYGGTESGTVCSITSAEWLERPGSVGRAIPPFSALVVDEDGNELPPGEEGRLYFRDATGRGIVYRGDPDKTAAAHLAPGVFTLGEIAYLDDEGYVFLTDRFSDMVLSGGVNLYPAESEAVLAAHPGVADVAVIGVPNDDLGEELKALVVPADPTAPPSEDDLLTFCRERLTSMKCPRSVELVDTVGRTAMGKVDKRALRAPYWIDR
jgi:acyl-CoA synthetase (AMP-forming)/AMP-acid ligase II